MTALLRRYNTVYNLVSFSLLLYAADCPFPEIDIIGAMAIVWRVRGKICAVLCATIVHSAIQIHINRHNSSLDLVLSHSAHFIVLMILCMYVCMCFVYHCILYVVVS